MRQIFILISCLASFLMTAAQSPNAGGKTSFRIRCQASQFPTTPLLIVDGVVKDEFDLNGIDPNTIESIDILKDAVAQSLYGIRGTAGVVIITTKTANQKTIYVKDILTGELLAGASIDLISFTNKKDTIHLIADSLGGAASKKLSYREEYELSVSSTGYKLFKSFLKREQINNDHTVLLARDYKNLEAVTVKSTQCITGPRISGFCSTPSALCGQFRCLAAGITINMLPDKGKGEGQGLSLKVYPNPVQRSQRMNIEFTSENEEMLSIRLISMDGKHIVFNEYKAYKGINRFEYPVDPKLASGIYGVQLVDQTNKLISSSKLIIQ